MFTALAIFIVVSTTFVIGMVLGTAIVLAGNRGIAQARDRPSIGIKPALEHREPPADSISNLDTGARHAA